MPAACMHAQRNKNSLQITSPRVRLTSTTLPNTLNSTKTAVTQSFRNINCLPEGTNTVSQSHLPVSGLRQPLYQTHSTKIVATQSYRELAALLATFTGEGSGELSSTQMGLLLLCHAGSINGFRRCKQILTEEPCTITQERVDYACVERF